MVPLWKAVKNKVLNEPVAILGLVSSAALIVNDELPVPSWAQALAVMVFTFIARAVVTGPLTNASRK